MLLYQLCKKVKKYFFAKKIFLFFMYIPPGGYVYSFAIYGAVDVIYICELNKQKNRHYCSSDGSHDFIYSHVV